MTFNLSDMVFIVPSLNEEQFIGRTIMSIRKFAGADAHIVVVDNGSTDRTVGTASSLGAECYVNKDLLIGGLRNFGVSKTTEKLLVFLDADVELTRDWASGIIDILDKFSENDYLVTGSYCLPPTENNWIMKYWFSSFATEEKSSHVGTGHMIVSRRLFLELCGFDRSLHTGEDYDFCTRAAKKGAEVVNDKNLKVYHYDFPSTAMQFFKREMWHGQGDVGSVGAVFSSRVALLSLTFIGIHIAALLIVVLKIKYIWLAAIALTALCFFSSLAKCRHAGAKVVLFNSLIFYLYFLGRAGSFFYRGQKL